MTFFRTYERYESFALKIAYLMEKWFLAHKSSFLWRTCLFLFFCTFSDPKECPVLISSLEKFFGTNWPQLTVQMNAFNWVKQVQANHQSVSQVSEAHSKLLYSKSRTLIMAL